ncbi:hypothetical protein A3778_15680 (plasmid) [Lacticaseibacillus paracasei]|uniref:hypothetical protein n=1 Tax=Lacticaseibacillus paracasei TaxID=1597 RepID=UPI0009C391C6|nr:hypothetical protein [Lacticaseibacillus paracasei]ARE45536.1 hypothetical protein A3778_15680 [Lacticaseibacillus paracasei]
MYAKFECSRKLRQFLKKKRQLSLSEAEKMISAADDYAIQNHFKEDVNFKIVSQDGIEYEDNLPIGTGQGWLHNLLLILDHAYQTVLSDQSTEAFKAFSDRVRQELTIEEQPKTVQEALPVVAHQEKAYHLKPIVSKAEEAVREAERPASAAAKQKSKKSKPVSLRRQARKKSMWQFPQLKRPKIRLSAQIIKRFVLAAATILVVAIFMLFLMRPKPVPSYQTLIQNASYVQAAKLYPSKHRDIEARLVKDNDEKSLAAFVQKYPSNNGRFDLAYMQNKFSTVISVSQDADLTAVRKVKLAISYIYQNQPENALTINSEIKSQQLQQLIFLALIHEGKLDQATTLAKSMNNKDADKVLEVGKTYQAAYEKAKADANNPKLSETDRKQALKDQHNWLALRKSLGGKSPYEESTNE